MVNRRVRLLCAAAVIALGLANTTADADSAARTRSDFVRRFARPRVRLSPSAITIESHGDLQFEKLTIASEVGVRVPILVVHGDAQGRRLPAVLCLHGLGGNKESMSRYLEALAHAGFVGVAIDARYHGERSGDLSAAMVRSFRDGSEHPYLWDTVWDSWRVLDYLETRHDVDRARFGVMGISLGGHTTWMVSADPRVKVAVPCISVCSWRWQLTHEGYKQRVSNLQSAFDGVRDAMGEKSVTPRVVAAAWERWLPSVPATVDCQDILAAFAPRPLLIIGGDSDPVAPIEGAREAFAVIEPAYKGAHGSDRLRIMIAEHSGHTVTADQESEMLRWFVRWLKPDKSTHASTSEMEKR